MRVFRYFAVMLRRYASYQIEQNRAPLLLLFYIDVKNSEIMHFALALSPILLYY